MGALIGGAAMDAKLKELLEKAGVRHQVRVGFLEGSTCGKNNDASAPQIANILEFGAVARTTLDSFKPGKEHSSLYHIPPRPFFRTMIARTSPTWSRLLQAALKNQDNDSASAMEMVGLKLSEWLQESIEEFDGAPNAPSTVAKKGFDKPLEESKNLKRAINFEVTE